MRLAFATVGLLLFGIASQTQAASTTQAEFDAAVAAANSAEKDAGVLKNRWTTTEQALASAKKAAAAGDFDTAVKEAQRAEALAKASIAQAKEQDATWKAAVLR